MNVGASKASDGGLYFQWGDTQGYTEDQFGVDDGKKYFFWNTYKWSIDISDSNFSKYTNASDKLELEDDAAHVNMGGDWHIPSPDQCQELIDETTTTWTTSDGVSGATFTSKKDKSKSIFIPSAGYARGETVDSLGEDDGWVWASMLNTNSATYAQFLWVSSKNAILVSDLIGPHINSRYIGFSIRGVIG